MELAAVFDSGELSAIPLELQTKFNDFIQKLHKNNEDLKANYEKLRVNSGNF